MLAAIVVLVVLVGMAGTVMALSAAAHREHRGSEEDLKAQYLAEAGVNGNTIVRVNKQGDIEVRRRGGWDVIGGLLGEFDERVRRETGLDWA